MSVAGPFFMGVDDFCHLAINFSPLTAYPYFYYLFFGVPNAHYILHSGVPLKKQYKKQLISLMGKSTAEKESVLLSLFRIKINFPDGLDLITSWTWDRSISWLDKGECTHLRGSRDAEFGDDVPRPLHHFFEYLTLIPWNASPHMIVSTFHPFLEFPVSVTCSV